MEAGLTIEPVELSKAVEEGEGDGGNVATVSCVHWDGRFEEPLGLGLQREVLRDGVHG